MINLAAEKILKNETLDFTCAKEVFDEIFSGLSSSISSSSLISLLASKYETSDIIASAVISANSAIKKIKLPYKEDSCVQNITEPQKDYFDFSITNDLICVCTGLCACDYTFSSPLFKKRKFKILSALNILNSATINEFERENYVLNVLDESEPYFKYSNEIKMNLKFKTILDTTDILLNPCNAKNLYLGIENKDDVEKFASSALKLNYTNSIIISGENELPFVTPYGETKIAEAWKNKIFTYDISPELLDLKNCNENDIKTQNNEHCAQLIKELSENKAPEAVFEGTVINAAMVLYISKKADSLIDGIDLAKKIILDNKLKEKIEEIQKFYS